MEYLKYKTILPYTQLLQGTSQSTVDAHLPEFRLLQVVLLILSAFCIRLSEISTAHLLL